MVTIIRMFNEGTNKNLFVGNPIPIHVRREGSDGLRFVVEITLIKQGTISTAEQTFSLEGVFVGDECILDISEYLRSFVALDVVDVNSTDIQYAINGRKRFTVSYSVRQSDDTVLESGGSSTTFQAFLGGMYREDWARIDSFVNMLSLQPKSQSTSLALLRHMYLYGASTGVQLNVVCTVYHFKGANTVIAENIASNRESIATTTIIPVAKILESVDLTTVWRIHIAFQDMATGVNMERTFDIDRVFRRQEKFFLFSNSLGGLDTVRLMGEETSVMEVETNTTTQATDYRYTAKNTGKKVVKSKSSQVYKVETGYKTRLELDYLSKEFLGSETVFEIISEGEGFALRAVTLLTKKIQYDMHSVKPQSVEIEYSYAL